MGVLYGIYKGGGVGFAAFGYRTLGLLLGAGNINTLKLYTRPKES